MSRSPIITMNYRQRQISLASHYGVVFSPDRSWKFLVRPENSGTQVCTLLCQTDRVCLSTSPPDLRDRRFLRRGFHEMVELLASRFKATWPGLVITHPEHGYYNTGNARCASTLFEDAETATLFPLYMLFMLLLAHGP